MDRIRVRNSATGIASQAPTMPRKCGRIRSESTIKTSVRRKEMMADTRPFERAVKKPEEAILIPLNRKFTAKIRKPASASSKVAGSWVKTDTRGVALKTAASVMTTEDTITKRNEVR